MSLQSVNPYNNQLLKTFEEDTDSQLISKIETAHSAFKKWQTTSFEHRAALMHQCAEVLRRHQDKYADIITSEMGKVWSESKAEVEKCATVCDFYAQHAAEYLKDEPLEVPAGSAFVQHAPLGIVLAVMPWNFPFWQVFRFAAPGLMAGNAGLLKHASNVPQCGVVIQEIFEEAGFPKGLFQNLLISSAAVEKVIDHPYVKAVTLTGSEKAGAAVAARAGQNIKKSVLELGGSDPFIVLADAPIESTAQVAAKARMINCGQSCIAAKRFIVEKSVYIPFMEAFVKEISQLQKGDPAKASTQLACMARQDLAEDLLQQVRRSVDKGAEVYFGSVPDTIEAAYFPPIVLSHVQPGMPAYNEELFGPVAAVIVVENEKEAIKVANDSDFGLGGSVWTADIQKGIALARQVESGAVYVNKMMASDPHVPFGGIKISGYGRELSHHGIKEFVNQKTIWAAS